MSSAVPPLTSLRNFSVFHPGIYFRRFILMWMSLRVFQDLGTGFGSMIFFWSLFPVGRAFADIAHGHGVGISPRVLHGIPTENCTGILSVPFKISFIVALGALVGIIQFFWVNSWDNLQNSLG